MGWQGRLDAGARSRSAGRREHGARYAQMSPIEKAEQSEAREKLERERLAAEARRLNQPLSELTLGDLIEAIDEALNKSLVPKL